MTDQTIIMNCFNIMEKNNDIDILAAQSHVQISCECTAQEDAIGTLRLLETIIKRNIEDKVRLYQLYKMKLRRFVILEHFVDKY